MTIDVLQLKLLQSDAQRDLEARYRIHEQDDLDGVAALVRAVVTNGHAGATPDLIDRLPKLEIICSASVGYDSIDVGYARARGIPVTNTPDVLNDDVADMAIALMMMTARRLVTSDAYVRAGRWSREGNFPLTTSTSGRRVGILGLGRIGLEVAARAQAMHNTILYHSRHPVPGVPYRYCPDPVRLAAESDFLMVVLPSTPQTQKIVDRAVLDALGPEGFLINVARGAVVDEDALIEALREGRLGGAGLDVFADEPHVPPALFGMDNVVLQPHAASATNETRRIMGQLVLDNLAAHFAGKPLLTPVT